LAYGGVVTRIPAYTDIEEMMLERGISIDHSTINRWVIHYAPLLENEFRKNYKLQVGNSWRMDETYIKNKRRMALSLSCSR